MDDSLRRFRSVINDYWTINAPERICSAKRYENRRTVRADPPGRRLGPLSTSIVTSSLVGLETADRRNEGENFNFEAGPNPPYLRGSETVTTERTQKLKDLSTSLRQGCCLPRAQIQFSWRRSFVPCVWMPPNESFT